MTTSIPIVGQWIGDVRGTDIGQAYAEAKSDGGGHYSFELRLNFSGVITIFDGEVDANDSKKMNLRSRPNANQKGITGAINFDEISAARLAGRWSLSAGNAGVIWLSPSNTAITQQTPSSSPKPVELVAKEAKFPNFVIYRRELEAIVSRLGSLIPSPAQVVITAKLDSQNVTQFADIFLKRTDLLGYLRDVKLNISDSGQPFARSILFVISDEEQCRFYVQSDDATWTNGVYANLLSLSNRYISRGLMLFQRYGLNFNGLIFLAALAMLPGMTLIPRIIFLTIVVLFLIAFKRTHESLVRTKIYLDDTVRFALTREYPAIISTLTASGIIALVSIIFSYLSGDTRGLMTWFWNLFH